MASRWLKLGLAGLLAVVGATAHADFFTDALKKHQEIGVYVNDKDVQSFSQANPMFGCYHIGRLQGVSDRLGKDISKMDQRAAGLSQERFERLNLARNFYQGLEQTVAGAIDGKGCDAQAKNRLKELSGGANSADHMRLAVAATRTMGAEDIIVRCLYLGRIATLLEGFRIDIDRRARAGFSTSRENAIYRAAYSKVTSHSKACGLEDFKNFKRRGELDI